ncbi:class I SAM-dependent methyltransferase [Marinobacter salinisoli]|uniref:Class I SAM-dependent methyltransferase n=1 Tax=Marinobacter salinisoli TaxID=2769486 RepID=A0ABX7MND9_9GAMM|nr:class I SAM-dependent methyltransferase [Marinobacter salinisoli]QSP93772.1 class I SAM-dependent methyltransferase [Marinobacter salinisoli]
MKKPETIDYAARHESFERWFQTPLGRALLADQRRMLDSDLARLTGARQLQVGISHRLPLATGTDFTQRIMTTPFWSGEISDGVVVCDSHELPFPSDSMDLVVLHHSADFSKSPHEVIREAARVLRGEGTIALIGLNPLSLWGLRRAVSRFREGPWGGRFLFRGRMEDWLHLLGFNIEVSATRFFRLPLQRSGRDVESRLDSRLAGNRILPLGAYYCIMARKRVYAGLPKRPVWGKAKVIALSGTRAIGASRGAHAGKWMQENTE